MRALLKGNNKREYRNVYRTYEYTRRKGNWKQTGGKNEESCSENTEYSYRQSGARNTAARERCGDAIKHTSGTPVRIHAVSHTLPLLHARCTGGDHLPYRTSSRLCERSSRAPTTQPSSTCYWSLHADIAAFSTSNGFMSCSPPFPPHIECAHARSATPIIVRFRLPLVVR